MRSKKFILALAVVPALFLGACLGPQTTGPSADADKGGKEMVSDVKDTEYAKEGKDGGNDGTIAIGTGTVLAKRGASR